MIVPHLTNMPPSSFPDDYNEGTHPQTLDKLCETNLSQQKPYGADEYSDRAKEYLRRSCSLLMPQFILLRAAPLPT